MKIQVNTKEEIIGDFRFGRYSDCDGNCYTVSPESEIAEKCEHYEIEIRPVGGYVEWCKKETE